MFRFAFFSSSARQFSVERFLTVLFWFRLAKRRNRLRVNNFDIILDFFRRRQSVKYLKIFGEDLSYDFMFMLWMLFQSILSCKDWNRRRVNLNWAESCDSEMTIFWSWIYCDMNIRKHATYLFVSSLFSHMNNILPSLPMLVFCSNWRLRQWKKKGRISFRKIFVAGCFSCSPEWARRKETGKWRRRRKQQGRKEGESTVDGSS